MRQDNILTNRMNNTKSARIIVSVVGIIYIVLTLFCLLKPADEFSNSERRALAQWPEFSWESLWSGDYIAQAEEYVVDQFPLRDTFRSLKAYFSLEIMQKQDTHDIYVKDGYLCAMEFPMDEQSSDRAADIFEAIYKNHIEGTNAKAYFAIVPDKNYFLVDNDTILTMDYDVFFETMHGKTEYLQKIDITHTLALEDYYKTDTHWKQEKIVDTAEVLAEGMDVPYVSDFAISTVEEPFYGVYYGQAGIKMEADEIHYCTNPLLEECKVYDHENGKEIPLYDTGKADGRDPYELFLGGNVSLVTIESPQALSVKELVVFGDSFSRSLIPLLAGSYHKITLYDIRYLPSAYIGNYIEFENQDVLFLYSTSVLNNSITLK